LNDLLDRVRSRGYWRVSLRPRRFVEKRVERLSKLETVIASAHVQIRGWDYPHISRGEELERHTTWVGHETDWERKLELWRLYLSGQFISYSAMSYDWRDRSGLWPPSESWAAGARLHVGDAIAVMSEFLLFASRLALTEVGDEDMQMSILVHGLSGRELEEDELPWQFNALRNRVAKEDEFTWAGSLRRTELVARHRDIAAELSAQLFELFRWDDSLSVVHQRQTQILGPST
jgi:hypothetical protein